MKQNRKRSKITRYNPDLVQTVRAEIAKHPNPMFVKMAEKGQMSDGDILDFALSVAHCYFSGSLLEPVKEAAHRGMDLMVRRTLLVTASLFGMTGVFDKDGGATLTPAWTGDPATQSAAVQALVDTGMSVKEAMALFASGPPKQGHMAETIHTQLPEVVH